MNRIRKHIDKLPILTVKQTTGVGVLLMLLVMIATGHLEAMHVKRLAGSNMDTLKQQCISFDRIVSADKTKSLFRMTDMMLDFSYHLADDDIKANDEYLEYYVDSMRLTGIALLDENLSLEASGYTRKFRKADWADTPDGSRYANIIDYPNKVFAERLEAGGEYYDIAAVARKDAPGILIGFYKQPSGLVSEAENDMESLLTGVAFENNGHYMVSENGSVRAASDPALKGKRSSDSDFLQKLSMISKDDSLHVFYAQGKYYWGYRSGCGNYSICIYYPAMSVFSAYASVGLIFAAVYFVLCCLYYAVRNRTLYENQERLLKEAQAAKIANNAKTEFLRRISHDIRTPINGIMGYVELAKNHPDDTELQKHCRDNIVTSLRTLMKLVNAILEMSELESNEIVLEDKQFDLKELLNEINTLIKPQAEECGIHCEISEDPAVRYLIGSPRHVSQILMNLVSNAVKYGKQGGFLHLDVHTVSQNDDSVSYEFICEDDGIGMSEAFMDHLYEPFMQEKESARTVYEGSGLGLSIVKKLVDAMGGSISCQSEKNVGTRFTVNLTFGIDRTRHVQQNTDNNRCSKLLQGKNVLIVEDNELNMEIAEYFLAEHGAIVSKAWNGQEGVEAFAASEHGFFALIVMDIMMPVMDGYDAARAIRALERPDAVTVPITAMSANAFDDDIKRSLDAGMNGHIAKPVDAGKLAEVLAKLLSAA